MAKVRKLRTRIRAVSNIRTIAKTMEMVASARFRKSQDQVSGARPYTDALSDLVGDLMERNPKLTGEHPLVREPEGVKRDVLMVLTSNRGLCGGYNTSVLRTAMTRYRQLADAGYEVALHVSGKRGIQNVKYRGYEIERAYTEFDFLPPYEAVGRIAEELMTDFMAGKIGGVEVAYMQYFSSSRQRPAISQILPMEHIAPPEPSFGLHAGERIEYELAPSPEQIMRNLFPATVRLRLWQCFLDASIAQRVMRIAAMHAATDNADDMIRNLTVRYNRMRQGQITAELSEIIGGRIGVK